MLTSIWTLESVISREVRMASRNNYLLLSLKVTTDSLSCTWNRYAFPWRTESLLVQLTPHHIASNCPEYMPKSWCRTWKENCLVHRQEYNQMNHNDTHGWMKTILKHFVWHNRHKQDSISNETNIFSCSSSSIHPFINSAIHPFSLSLIFFDCSISPS